MNITLRCQGSKRERARPPISEARRRAPCRVGCRGDATNATLNARTRPNRPQGYRYREACSCRPCQASASPPRRAAALISPCRERIGLPLHQCRTRLPRSAGSTRSSGSPVRSGCRRGQSQPKNCAGLFSVLSNIGTRFSRSQIGVARSALFDVSLVPSATELTAEVVQYEVSVSLDIVGANGWGTYDKTRP
jgi:hypothetical protein